MKVPDTYPATFFQFPRIFATRWSTCPGWRPWTNLVWPSLGSGLSGHHGTTEAHPQLQPPVFRSTHFLKHIHYKLAGTHLQLLIFKKKCSRGERLSQIHDISDCPGLWTAPQVPIKPPAVSPIDILIQSCPWCDLVQRPMTVGYFQKYFDDNHSRSGAKLCQCQYHYASSSVTWTDPLWVGTSSISMQLRWAPRDLSNGWNIPGVSY